MILSKTLKYPVLIMGIIMFSLFLADGKTKIWWEKTKRRFVPSTCDSLESRLKDKVPNNWEISCPTADLLNLEIDYPGNESLEIIRVKMYKSIANTLVQFSNMANPETLEYLKDFRLKMESDKVTIYSQTDGEAMLAFRKLKHKEKIAEHLKLTVKVKEEIK